MAHEETFEGWMILELMGRRKLAGMVREVTIAGAGFLRIDVPSGDGVASTQFYPPSSVYAISPVTEDVARRYAAHNQPQPVTRWELPALPSPTQDEFDDPEQDYLDNRPAHYGDN